MSNSEIDDINSESEFEDISSDNSYEEVDESDSESIEQQNTFDNLITYLTNVAYLQIQPSNKIKREIELIKDVKVKYNRTSFGKLENKLKDRKVYPVK